jgi:hypothetical protein
MTKIGINRKNFVGGDETIPTTIQTKKFAIIGIGTSEAIKRDITIIGVDAAAVRRAKIGLDEDVTILGPGRCKLQLLLHKTSISVL